MLRHGFWGAALCAASAVSAQTAQGDVSVTIYNNNLTLVQDLRTITVSAGRSRQEFPDVSAQIRPETVTLAGQGIGIVEQNFDYDLLSPDKLMEKAVGQMITIVRTNPATGAETREQARVLAANGGIVLQIGNRIEVLRDDGLPVRVVFDKVPENLRARPTLSVTIDAAQGGAIPTRLSYLTPGLGWTSDYVALFDEAKNAIDVQGWVTLNNNTGTDLHQCQHLACRGQCRRRLCAVQCVGRRCDDRGGWHRKRDARTARRFLSLSARRTHNDCQCAAKAGQLSRCEGGGGAQGPMSSSMAGSAPTMCHAVLRPRSNSRPRRRAVWAISCLPGTVRVYMRDARGDPQFIGEKSDRATPRWGHRCRSAQVKHSMSRSRPWSKRAPGFRRTAGGRRCATPSPTPGPVR